MRGVRDTLTDSEYKDHITVKLPRLSLKGDLSAIINTFLTPGQQDGVVISSLNSPSQMEQPCSADHVKNICANPGYTEHIKAY